LADWQSGVVQLLLIVIIILVHNATHSAEKGREAWEAYQHFRRCRCLDTGRPATVTVGEWLVSLKSRVIQQGYCEYWPPNNSSRGDTGDGQILNQLSGVNLWQNFYVKWKKIMI